MQTPKRRDDVLRALCARVTDEDGRNPKFEKKEQPRRGISRKDLQLCKQVLLALTTALQTEVTDRRLRDIEVVAVDPDPDATRLRVSVRPCPGAAIDVHDALAALKRAKGSCANSSPRLPAASACRSSRSRPPHLPTTRRLAVTDSQHAPPRHAWLVEPLPRGCAAAIDRFARLDDVRHIAIMPDVHGGSEGSGLGAGLVLATGRLLIPQAVGADIGCGMSTCRLGVTADAITDEAIALSVLTAIKRAVPIIRHGHRLPPTLPPELADCTLSTEPLSNALTRDGTIQFGTLGRGRGNHFLELQRDEENELWLLVHSGSRAMGQIITQAHLARAAKQSGIAVLDAETDAGRAYTADVTWTTEYARLSRAVMLHAATQAMAGVLNTTITPSPAWGTAHNTLTREEHHGEHVWVHRRGAAPAHAGLANVIPGSMAVETFHVEGRGHPDSLSSSSHGAGRAYSRTEATKRNSTKDLSRQLRDVYFDADQLPRLRDEAPAAYRDIRTVMRAQSDLVRITRRLAPVLTFKGV